MIAQGLAGVGLGQLLIYVIVFLGICIVAYLVITKGLGVTIPPWVVQVFWVLVAVVVGIFAIRFLLSL